MVPMMEMHKTQICQYLVTTITGRGNLLIQIKIN